jgi:putative membrane protein (TIGR04086 family)
MEKRGERKEGVPVLALAKCLLASYVLTLLLLCLLALLLYKLHLTEGMVTIAISAIYVITTFMAGFLAGKKMKTQKFLWGALLGAA